MGTYRDGLALPSLDPDSVMLEDGGPEDLLRKAMALAKELRYVGMDQVGGREWAEVLAAATDDWSGYLGEVNGPLHLAFQQFFADPLQYKGPVNGPLGQPHVALFVVFLHILRHARAQVNAFPRRHLDYYFQEVLGLRMRELRPATAHVVFVHAADTEGVALPEGTVLNSGDDDGPLFETLDTLSLNAATLGGLAYTRARFKPTGLRAMLLADSTRLDMGMILAHIESDHLKQRLLEVAPAFTGLQAMLDFLNDPQQRDQWKLFPSQLMGCNSEDFKQMMAMAPDTANWTPRDRQLFGKWEALHAQMLIEQNHRSSVVADVGKAYTLEEKLTAALYNGHALPAYKGQPAELDQLYRDLRSPKRVEDTAIALNYLREHLHMEENAYCALYEESRDKRGLSKYPAAIHAARMEKAALLDSCLLQRQLDGVSSGMQAGMEGGTVWRPFGHGVVEAESGASEFALVVSSPILAMAEGSRQVELVMEFGLCDLGLLAGLVQLAGTDAGAWRLPLRFTLSGAKAWIAADWRSRVPVLDLEGRSLRILLDLPSELPAVTAPEEGFVDASYLGKGPCLRIGFDPTGIAQGAAHALVAVNVLRSLRIARLSLEVKVTGITELIAGNHQGEVKVSAPFEPFGTQPEPNAAFMLANREICLKRLDRLDIAWEWMGAPNNFATYYDSYFDAMGGPAVTSYPHGRTDFKARAELVIGRRSYVLGAGEVSFLGDRLELSMPEDTPKPGKYDAETISSWDMPNDWPRYIRLVYSSPWSPEVVHEEAERRHTAALLAASNEFAAASVTYAAAPNGGTAPNTNAARFERAQQKLNQLSGLALNPPYIPKLKQMHVGYVASEVIELSEWDPQPTADLQLYHQQPLGLHALPLGGGAPQSLLAHVRQEGLCMMGFGGLEQGQTLSLLLRTAMGGTNNEVPPPSLEWWYYGALGWRQLPAYCLELDETRGLLTSGLLRIKMPMDAQVAETALPGRLHWLAAKVQADCDNVPGWEGLHLHASRVRQLSGGATKAKLPAGTVSGMEVSNPSVAAVWQPYVGTGGRAAETAQTFYSRISKRLRHRNRALSGWDYENLCLDQFPQLYAAKAVQARGEENSRSGEFRLVVVPSLDGQLFSDPFQPQLGYGELMAMGDYLQSLAPPTAHVKVCNPRYRRVLVGTTLSYVSGMSVNLGRHKVQERLNRLLAPWAYSGESRPSFGGRLYVSEVVDALQSEDYISFVGKTRLFVVEDDGTLLQAEAMDGDTSAFISVSDTEIMTTAGTHVITEVGAEDASQQIWEGIAWMVVGGDFKVRVDPDAPPVGYEDYVGVSWMVIGKDFKVGKHIPV